MKKNIISCIKKKYLAFFILRPQLVQTGKQIVKCASRTDIRNNGYFFQMLIR